MVKVDFTIYNSFATCPAWWRNFVLVTTSVKDLTSDSRNKLLIEGMAKYHGKMIDADNDDEEDIDNLEFETEEDLNAFKLYWALYGE